MNLFKKYTQQYLSGAELEESSQEMLEQLQDYELRKKWTAQLAADQGITREQASVKTRLRPIRPLLAIAATIALLLTVGYFIMPMDSGAQQLTAQYLAEPFPNSEERKGSEEVMELKTSAIAAYAAHDFKQAAILRQSLVEQVDTPTQNDYFYLGLSYLYQQPAQPDQAIVYLQKAVSFDKSTLMEESSWYLALAYLDAGQKENARQQLQQIVERQSWQWENAKILLTKIDD
jgi:tetratricopeptide (TPR) repeat protein